MRDLACCSLRMMKGLPYSSKTMDMVAALWGRRSGLRLSGNSATACSEDFSTRAALPEGSTACLPTFGGSASGIMGEFAGCLAVVLFTS